MKMSRSSIFNFDTLDLKEFPVAKTATLFLTLLLALAAFEVGSRIATSPAGHLWEYWSPEAGASFEEVRRLQQADRGPQVLIVGDSTAHSNLDPTVMASVLERESWNMATSGNFPMAFQQTTLRVLERCPSPPEIVVASLIPAGFLESGGTAKSEAGILSAPVCRRQKGGLFIADYCAIARLRFCIGALRIIRNGIYDRIVDQRGHAAQTGLSESTADTASKQQLSGELSAHRLAVIEQLLEIADKRKFKVVIVIPPTMEKERRQPTHDSLAKYLASLRDRFDFLTYDGAADNSIEQGDFFDRNHLNVEGARKISLSVATAIRNSR